MSEHLDNARSVRQGEELDLEPLARYLRENVPELASNAEVSVQQFPSGHSNLTYLVRAGEREYVLRRPPFGSKVKSAHDMGREHRVLSKLHAVYPKAPEPVAYCEDESILGAKFYVMRRIQGIILRKELPPGLELAPERLRALQENLVDTLVELHAIDYERAGLAELGKPEGYVERQVAGWTKRYADSKTDDFESVEQVARWLAEHIPKHSDTSLIHNDYKLDNVVLDPNDPTRIIGVLDWEMSTIGDPLMDLGTALCYWVQADDPPTVQAVRWGPTHLPGSLTRREIVDRYAEKSGRNLEDAIFYFAFGLFKTGVVIQQIYYRYKQGLTKDERFAHLIWGVRVVCDQAQSAIQTGKL
ncbi:MAG TPA: phosphotransferase family protein [Polyangiaceae bacterium]|nr:phosphotransferase family protein [Polyangiaceae bacterium]